jgi:hypothetical protein
LLQINAVAQKKNHNTFLDHVQAYFSPNVSILHLMPSINRKSILIDWQQADLCDSGDFNASTTG